MTAPVDSNDGECKECACDDCGSCATECLIWWYTRTKEVQDFAMYSLYTMVFDTVVHTHTISPLLAGD